MKKIITIQPLLPNYLISFFNQICLDYKNIELVVFADISSNNPLNQYRKSLCKFKVVDLKLI